MKRSIILLILILSAHLSYAGTMDVTKKVYFADYVIYAGMSPVMSTDGKTVSGWKTSFRIKHTTSAKTYMKLWTDSETNILNYDLTEPADHTKSEFVINSSSWLEAQQHMFVNAHKLMVRLNRDNNAILPKVVYASIEFTNNKNVKLIDLSNGPLPTGEMTDSALPTIPNQISPANEAELKDITQVTLSWSANNATKYIISFKEGTGQETLYETTQTSINIAVVSTLQRKVYWWRVKSENDNEDVSEYSSSCWFGVTATQTATSFRFWGIRSADVNWVTGHPGYDSHFGMIGDIKMFASSDATGTNLVSGKTAYATTSNNGQPPSLTNDNDSFSYWSTIAGVTSPQSLWFDFGTQTEIHSLNILPPNLGMGMVPYARKYDVIASNDAIMWTIMRQCNTANVSWRQSCYDF